MRHKRAIKRLITRLGGFRAFLDKDGQDEPNKDKDGKQGQETD
jgi:hypothetical protein